MKNFLRKLHIGEGSSKGASSPPPPPSREGGTGGGVGDMKSCKLHMVEDSDDGASSPPPSPSREGGVSGEVHHHQLRYDRRQQTSVVSSWIQPPPPTVVEAELPTSSSSPSSSVGVGAEDRNQQAERERRRSQEEETTLMELIVRLWGEEEMGRVRERRRSQEQDEVERVIRESLEAEKRKREREKEEDDLEAYQIQLALEMSAQQNSEVEERKCGRQEEEDDMEEYQIQLVLEMSALDNPEDMGIEVAKQLSLAFCPPQRSPTGVLTERHGMDHSSSELPRDIPFQLLEEITDGFSKDRTLGSGAFGKVYMGVHKNGEKIAVKMLYDMPGLEKEQFQNEFSNLARLQHPNIVRLVGYCHEVQTKCVEHNGRLVLAERIRRALCFEYMHYGSLDKHLSDEHCGLDWNTRYKLIKGVCKGLKYLHEELKCPLYHLDLKPANILLDEKMLPKIADFGLSRFFGEERTQIAKSFKGTLGYIPPEYIEQNIISNKYDIFSLGVVILKIITGPMGYSRSTEMSHQEFIELVHKNWSNRLQATPMHLFESHSKQVKRCMEIALSCVEADRHKRPTIGDIIIKLNEAETTILTSSKQRLMNDQGSSMDKVSTSRSAVEFNWMGIPTDPSKVPVPQLAIQKDTLLTRLKTIIEGCINEAWTYAIFWESSVDAITGSSLLSWGNGYYKECQFERWAHKRHCTPEEQAEQEHRKRVLSNLYSLIEKQKTAACSPSEDVEVNDTEWFFLISMAQSFPNGSGLPGNALLSVKPIWIAIDDLSNAPCERARQAYTFGIRTMVCVPIGTSVIELGSTNFVFQTAESIPRIISLFNQGAIELIS